VGIRKILCLFVGGLCLVGCQEKPSDDKVHITYWEKWSGFEAEAMQRTVDQFNRSQDKIVVEFLSLSSVDRKALIATAGGDPPDVVGLWAFNVYSFADRDALQPLDDFIRGEGSTPKQWLARYEPVYADMCTYRGHVWAGLSTPSMTALHWNKAMFRADGLDPDRPPRTLTELDVFAEKLTKRDPKTGEIVQLGFLPQEPNWFAWAYPLWFGGQLLDNDRITIGTDPHNLQCYQWVESFTSKYGLDQVRAFFSGFGNFASPQNAFLSGKVAMEFQGVWMNNFIRQFVPGMEYGVAAWPTAAPGLDDFTVADTDLLAIPRGAKHPREAWELIKFISSANLNAQREDELSGVELVCYLQGKNSPLRQWSPFFEQHHPHPYIGVFRQLARSPHAVHLPKMGIWQEYRRETDTMFDAVRLLAESPEQALAFCQRRISESWSWHRKSLERRQTDSTGKPLTSTPRGANITVAAGFSLRGEDAPISQVRKTRSSDAPVKGAATEEALLLETVAQSP
jgi:ABC-type glycerol-3-phosphate transport system substrate-binding protein